MGYTTDPPMRLSRWCKLETDVPVRAIPVWCKGQDPAPYYERWTRFGKGTAEDYDAHTHGPDPEVAGFKSKTELRIWDLGGNCARVISVTARQLEGWLRLQNANGARWGKSVLDITRSGSGMDTVVTWRIVKMLTDEEARRLAERVEACDWSIAPDAPEPMPADGGGFANGDVEIPF